MLTFHSGQGTLQATCPKWRVTLSLRPRMTRVKRAHLHGLILSDWLSVPRRRAFRNPLQNRLENKISPVSTVVPERIFVEIGLQVILSNGVIDSANSRFNQSPKSLNGIGVNVSHDVHARGMMDAPVGVSLFHVRDSVITNEFIGEHHRTGKNSLFHHAEQCRQRFGPLAKP